MPLMLHVWRQSVTSSFDFFQLTFLFAEHQNSFNHMSPAINILTLTNPLGIMDISSKFHSNNAWHEPKCWTEDQVAGCYSMDTAYV